MTGGAAPLYRIRLRKLHIRNFRGIDDLTLDFVGSNGRPLDMAVLAGENGCGKTSVLAAIVLCVKHSEQSEPASIRFGGVGYEILGEFDFTTGEAADDSPVQIGRRSLPDRPWDEISSSSAVAVNELKTADLEYFSVLRIPLLTKQLVDVSKVMQPVGNLNELLRVAQLQNRIISAYYRQLRNRSAAPANSPYDRIKAWWRRFVPDTELDVLPVSNDPGSGDEVIVREAGREIPIDVTSYSMARRLAASRPDIPSMVTLDRLSSGQLGILAFAGPIIFRDQPPDIVLIDEPEQHLHVRWQREILPALRALSPTTQYVVATHSEEILSAALAEERFILVGEGDPRAVLADDEEDATGDVH